MQLNDPISVSFFILGSFKVFEKEYDSYNISISPDIVYHVVDESFECLERYCLPSSLISSEIERFASFLIINVIKLEPIQPIESSKPRNLNEDKDFNIEYMNYKFAIHLLSLITDLDDVVINAIKSKVNEGSEDPYAYLMEIENNI